MSYSKILMGLVKNRGFSPYFLEFSQSYTKVCFLVKLPIRKNVSIILEWNSKHVGLFLFNGWCFGELFSFLKNYPTPEFPCYRMVPLLNFSNGFGHELQKCSDREVSYFVTFKFGNSRVFLKSSDFSPPHQDKWFFPEISGSFLKTS